MNELIKALDELSNVADYEQYVKSLHYIMLYLTSRMNRIPNDKYKQAIIEAIKDKPQLSFILESK